VALGQVNFGITETGITGVGTPGKRQKFLGIFRNFRNFLQPGNRVSTPRGSLGFWEEPIISWDMGVGRRQNYSVRESEMSQI
jgi:hypothetical protein